jgi:hypothetical protein
MCCVDWTKVGSVLQSIAPAISWILVIVGWGIVSRGHNKREDRKEARASLIQLGDLVRKIEENAHQYLVSSAASAESRTLSIAIKRDLKRLAGDLQRFAESCNGVQYRLELIAFRQAVTGGEFDSKKRTACGADSVKLAEVSTGADDLLAALEGAFVKHFR